MDTLIRDLRFAVRSLARDRVFAAVALLTGGRRAEGVLTGIDGVSPGYFRTLGIPLLAGRDADLF